YIVPGNHERSRIPLQIWTVHPNLHIFHEPQTFIDRSAGLSVAMSGFPFARRIGNRFVELLESTGYREVEADIHLLCLHQSVEGAKVGPIGFTFRPGEDVIQGSEVPDCFDAVLSGHIHRSQVLKWDLNSQPMPAPVIYPGSVERTAFAERFEDKHYAVVAVKAGTRKDKPEVAVKFHRLPARPMVIIERAMDSSRSCDLIGELRRDLSALDPDTIVRVQISGVSPGEKGHGLSAARLREIVPKSMNISLRFVDGT
ncbi:MAG: exonuclease SbcCD subunit D, partial [Candidatus Promineifilaceae bacterium]